MKPFLQTVTERIRLVSIDKVQFVLAEIGINGGLLGAALWVKRRYVGREVASGI